MIKIHYYIQKNGSTWEKLKQKENERDHQRRKRDHDHHLFPDAPLDADDHDDFDHDALLYLWQEYPKGHTTLSPHLISWSPPTSIFIVSFFQIFGSCHSVSASHQFWWWHSSSSFPSHTFLMTICYKTNRTTKSSSGEKRSHLIHSWNSCCHQQHRHQNQIKQRHNRRHQKKRGNHMIYTKREEMLMKKILFWRQTKKGREEKIPREITSESPLMSCEDTTWSLIWSDSSGDPKEEWLYHSDDDERKKIKEITSSSGHILTWNM